MEAGNLRNNSRLHPCISHGFNLLHVFHIKKQVSGLLK